MVENQGRPLTNKQRTMEMMREHVGHVLRTSHPLSGYRTKAASSPQHGAALPELNRDDREYLSSLLSDGDMPLDQALAKTLETKRESEGARQQDPEDAAEAAWAEDTKEQEAPKFTDTHGGKERAGLGAIRGMVNRQMRRLF